MFDFTEQNKRWVTPFLIFIVTIGVVLRLWHIAQNNFFIYDEGLYLNYNMPLLRLIHGHAFTGWKDLGEAFYTLIRFALRSGKALWFVIVDSRAFWGWLYVWWYSRVISMFAGIFTLVVVYIFAKRFYHSKGMALLSVAILAVYPSHVFYSRLGFQEALCTFFFVTGLYFYFFPRTFGVRTVISAMLFVCVFFTNYRLIIAPVFVGFTEIYMSIALKEPPQLRKYLWHTLIFLFFVVVVGNMEEGINTLVTFGWMFYQANLAHDKFDWFNLLSYPYYLFRLDSVMAGLLFFTNIYFLWRREWLKGFPFLFVFLMMLIFALPFEKGARYLCIGLPFVAMALAAIVVNLRERCRNRQWSLAWGIMIFLLFVGLVHKSIVLATSRSDYESSMKFLLRLDPQVKVLSTQHWVQNLFVPDENQLRRVSKDFRVLITSYAEGFRYLMIDPQAYISYTDTGKRFEPPLINYMAFMTKHIRPVKSFSHFNKVILERFVFEHNENLRQSIKFLAQDDRSLGTLRIYDISHCLETIARVSLSSEK